MGLRQAIRFSISFVYREFLHTLYTLKVPESIQRDFGCPGRETENLRSLIPCERLQCSPEPDNVWIGARVAIVVR
jgi:hypothetical protein